MENRWAEPAMTSARATRTSSLYDVHPGVAMVQKWVAELNSKTGRSLEEWIALVKNEGPKDEKSRRAWRSEEHTSELQSQSNLVCRLLLEKKKNTRNEQYISWH